VKSLTIPTNLRLDRKGLPETFITNVHDKLECLTIKDLSSLMFVSKVRAYQSETPLNTHSLPDTFITNVHNKLECLTIKGLSSLISGSKVRAYS
jgi:hypothetical protein